MTEVRAALGIQGGPRQLHWQEGQGPMGGPGTSTMGQLSIQESWTSCSSGAGAGAGALYVLLRINDIKILSPVKISRRHLSIAAT